MADNKDLIAEKDLEHLGDILAYFLTQRTLGKPVVQLHRSIHDMRLLLQRIIVNDFLQLPLAKEEKFLNHLVDFLSEACEDLTAITTEDAEDYLDYCMGRIIDVFEEVQKVKLKTADPETRTVLFNDVPILRPFDYGLRNNFKVLKDS